MNEKEINKLVEQVKKADNILIALSSSPSVDELSSALGLTLMLNKNGRRATAIFSGEMPDVLHFLQPEKTFDTSVDSLRDFIVTLDAKKADRVVTKAENDMVKIYITPSGQTVSANDLEFSQGDYNVDLVIALGVGTKDLLDQALAAHGRILHNAAVVSLMIGGRDGGDLGGLNIRINRASSYAELIAHLPALLDRNLADEDEPAMDKAVATALLTGIVATTNRFSNKRTTPEVMALAADLMKAGANQQLIARELAKAKEIILNDDKQLSASDEAVLKDEAVLDLKQERDEPMAETQVEAAAKTELLVSAQSNEAQPAKTQLASVKTMKVEPNFANLEEYNREQLKLERQDVADELSSRVALDIEVPAAAATSSEDDQLAQQLEQIKQTPVVAADESAAEVTTVAQPDPNVVFGREDKPYLNTNDLSQAWSQATESPTVAADSSIVSSDASLPVSPAYNNTSISNFIPVTPPVVPAPESSSAPTASTVVEAAEVAPVVNSEATALSQNAVPTLPPMSDFGDFMPPLPPTPPNFAMSMPPLPPTPAQPPFMPVTSSDSGLSSNSPNAVAENANSMASPVMQDQVYPQPVDNAQFVIPE